MICHMILHNIALYCMDGVYVEMQIKEQLLSDSWIYELKCNIVHSLSSILPQQFRQGKFITKMNVVCWSNNYMITF